MEEERNNGVRKISKTYVLGFVVFGIVLLLVTFVPMILSRQGNDYSQDTEDDGVSENEELSNSIYVTFTNGYQLEYSVGKTTANKLLLKIGEIIGGIEEKERKREGIVEADIIEVSFKDSDVNSGFGYSFDVQIIDGSKYKVWVRTDSMYGNVYYSCLVIEEESDEDKAYLTIAMTSEDTDYMDRRGVIEELSTWARELLLSKNIVLNVTEL